MAVNGQLTYSQIDFDSEQTVALFPVPVRTAANWAAQETLKGDLFIALAAVVRGTKVRDSIANMSSVVDPTPPVDPESQREDKWLVQYHDNTTGKKRTLEIGCADRSLLDPSDRKHAYIGDGDVVDAFVTAFEAAVISFDEGTTNSVTVDEITYVARNL
jgi:hypothetical protein